LLLLLAAGQACAQTPAPAAAQSVPAGSASGAVRRIFTPAPVQWDHAMLSFRPALQYTATDFANLTGGLAFGMSPAQVNARLSEPHPGVSWNDLPPANEYPGDVRFLAVPIDRAGVLRMDLTACAGNASAIVLLFTSKGLFRLSYRLAGDRKCPDTNEAAQEIFARYVPIGQTVATSMRYRTGKTQVVEITDPLADLLAPIRWREGMN
jgi:hypothetical protein